MGDLSIQNLVVEYYSGGYALRPINGLNLDVEAGSLVILLGPSGCGKTTLLSCLGGILRPKSGAIKFEDVDITTLEGPALAKYRRDKVGIVFQAFNLVPSLTALENVMVPLRSAGMSRAAARKRAEELLTRVNLGDRMKHRPGDLSGGQQQRVAVARAIALDPPLILADEPTAHLDFIQVEEVLRLIRELADDDRVVVVATHDSRMLPLADRVVELTPDFAETDREPETVELKAGEVLFEQSTMGDLIYVVSEGEFEIVHELADGGEELFKVVGPGDYFGEIGVLFHLPRSATVRARTDATAVGYTAPAFRERLGAGGLRDLIEHRALAGADTEAAEPATTREERAVPNAEQASRMASGKGFVAALDQSGGSTPKALRLYGIEDDEYSGEEEMFDLIHQMRSRIITSPVFNGDRVLAAILFEQTMDRDIADVPSPTYLWETKGVVPILKIDKGLADASDDVQLMKPMPGLDELLERAVRKGVFGTKERSVIGGANPDGIAAVVAQQFEVANRVLSHGLVPIIEPEVTISISDKAEAEDILREEITKQLETVPDGQQVMLKLTLPSEVNHYRDFVGHPKVMRVLALSGGYSRADANKLLAENTGVIASFSRALTEGLSADQSDKQFNATLDASIQSIYDASVAG